MSPPRAPVDFINDRGWECGRELPPVVRQLSKNHSVQLRNVLHPMSTTRNDRRVKTGQVRELQGNGPRRSIEDSGQLDDRGSVSVDRPERNLVVQREGTRNLLLGPVPSLDIKDGTTVTGTAEGRRLKWSGTLLVGGLN